MLDRVRDLAGLALELQLPTYRKFAVRTLLRAYDEASRQPLLAPAPSHWKACGCVSPSASTPLVVSRWAVRG